MESSDEALKARMEAICLKFYSDTDAIVIFHLRLPSHFDNFLIEAT